MKLLFVLISIVFSTAPAYAYIEVADSGDAVATAGEQNTNLYKLHSLSATRLKAMRNIDETLSKNPNAERNLNMQEIETLMSEAGTVNDGDKVQLEQSIKDVKERTKNKVALIIKNPDDYEHIAEVAGKSVKDMEAIATLRKLRRLR